MNYSVVIPTSGRTNFLERCLRSLDSQTIPPEVVVVADNSVSAETCILNKRLVTRLDVHSRHSILYLDCKGASNASVVRNRGASLLSSSIIAFLDDDDWWDKDKAAMQLSEFSADTLVATANTVLVRSCGKTELIVRSSSDLTTLYTQNDLGGCSNIMIDRLLFNSLGGFDERLESCQDWDLWIRAAGRSFIAFPQTAWVYYDATSSIKISRNVGALYKGRRTFFFIHRSLIERKFLFQLVLYRARFYNFISLSSLLLCFRAAATNNIRLGSLFRVAFIYLSSHSTFKANH